MLESFYGAFGAEYVEIAQFFAKDAEIGTDRVNITQKYPLEIFAAQFAPRPALSFRSL